MKLISINIGKPVKVNHENKVIETAIFKYPVHEPTYLSELGLEGDEQANKMVHGGVDMALCIYSFDHYPYWEEQLGRKLGDAAFGENITISGLSEKEICIGDTFQLGDAVIQISQPRKPCFKLGIKYELVEMPLLVRNSGYTGCYMRVIQPGMIAPDSQIKLLSRHPAGVTIDFANGILHHDTENKEGLLRLLSVQELAQGMREQLESRLLKL